MTTVAERRAAVASERMFFFIMALAIAVTVATGFGLDQALGRATFAMFPWQVHVHAIVFSSWILLYVAQNWLIVRGNVAFHRQLGWVGAGIACVMVPLGLAATVMALARGGVPSFFPPGVFLILDGLGILAFGGLTGAAIALRQNAAWHKRLMLCGTIMVMSPAIGRILPMPLLGPMAPLAVFVTMIAFVIAGMVFDIAIHRRIHRAYWVGAGVLTLVQALVGPLGFSGPVVALAARIAG